MSTQVELLAAIAARLDDDEPRRVYADWLSERGDPRGEFITLQCDLARASPRATGTSPLAERCSTLFAAHAAGWEPDLGPGLRWRFARGFPERVEGTASTLLALGRRLLEAVPTLTAATATRTDVPIEALLSWPVLGRLRGLGLHYLPRSLAGSPGGGADDAAAGVLRTMLDDRRLQHLEALSVSYSYLSQDAWEAIARSALLPRLRVLELGLCNARDDGVAALMAARSSLSRLSVANGQLGTAGVQAIASAASARTLTSLDLSWNRLGVRAARALAASETLTNLQHLDLSHCQIGDAGCVALAGGKLTGLKELRLARSRVGSAGARALMRHPSLPAVELDLTDLDPGTRAAVRERFALIM